MLHLNVVSEACHADRGAGDTNIEPRAACGRSAARRQHAEGPGLIGLHPERGFAGNQFHCGRVGSCSDRHAGAGVHLNGNAVSRRNLALFARSGAVIGAKLGE